MMHIDLAGLHPHRGKRWSGVRVDSKEGWRGNNTGKRGAADGDLLTMGTHTQPCKSECHKKYRIAIRKI